MEQATFEDATFQDVPFEELGTALFDVTFTVLDLETTGLSPGNDRITEVGAVKVHRGEVIGQLATLVHPGRPIPPAITSVTGITDAMVRDQPPVETVLPMLLEFVRGTVLVAHNARFDTSFLDAELGRHGYPPLSLPVVDTAALARRLLRDEVRNVRLATLARHLRARVSPEHRALPDARATVDVLHGLLERAGSLGATTLEDLQAYMRSSSDRAFRKIGLVADAPETCGIYRFHDEGDRVLYVGKATDLRSRLRTYFGQDRRRRIADLVRETRRVTWTATPTLLEAEVREVRAIQELQPRYNRRSKHPGRTVWIRLTTEPFPRLSIVRRRHDDGSVHIGPLSSHRQAETVVAAVHEALPLRQCTTRLRVAQDHRPCVLKDLGRCGAPCDGTQSREDYGAIAEHFADTVRGDPRPLLTPLRQRMEALSADARFEDAAATRGRLHALATALAATRRSRVLRDTAVVVAVRPTGDDDLEAVRLERGRLAASSRVPAGTADAGVLAALTEGPGCPPDPAADAPGGDREELELTRRWLEQPHVRTVAAEGRLAEPWPGGAALTAALDEQAEVRRRLRRDRQRMRGAKVKRRA